MIRLRSVCIVGVITAAPLLSQCITLYTDGAVSADRTSVSAWTVTTDNYTNLNTGCAPINMTRSFTHNYENSVTIQSPSGRTVTGVGSRSQASGSTPGYDRADATLLVGGDTGIYSIRGTGKAICSIIGLFLLMNLVGPPQDIPCGYPTNFHQDGAGIDLGGGSIRFQYKWASSTGSLRDLGQCSGQERVTYDGLPDPFTFPAPFPPHGPVRNPTLEGFGLAADGMEDTQSMPGTFRTPYFQKDVVAHQVYRYHCPCYRNDDWQTLAGPLTILRRVYQDSNTGRWIFQICKDSVTPVQHGTCGVINPLP
jgi:hypothetical protein